MIKHLLFLISFFCLTSILGQNTSLFFNGQNENLVIEAKPEFQMSDNFTIEAWISASEWKSQSWAGTIIGHDGASTDGYVFRAGDNGRLSFTYAADGIWQEVLTDAVMIQNQWHHIAATVGSGEVKLYIDGLESASKPVSGIFTPATSNLFIGESSGFAGRFWEGFIDEIRIWNVTRTQEQLVDNASVELTGLEPSLSLNLTMNEGIGNTTMSIAPLGCEALFINMDESNWSEGYSIPQFDIAMSKVKGIDVLNMKTRPVNVIASFANNGMAELSNVDLVVSVDGTELFTETAEVSIAPGEVIDYTFETPLDLIDVDNPTVSIVAVHPDDQNTLNNEGAITINTADGNIVRLFDYRQHNFGAAGQLNTYNAQLPTDLSEYSQILMHIDLRCPTTGCDPWDQPASIRVVSSEGEFELARYMTPFGIACGDWTVDVTDFKEILTGELKFESFVQVWGPSGWLVNIDLEFIEGDNMFPHQKITPLWTTNYHIYGDPGISHDLDTQSLILENNTEASHIRATVTGHGQGNSLNAAEFLQRTHQYVLNGTTIDNHNLWNTDCSTNSCSEQLGTWLFSRAGWCPGESVEPYLISTDMVNAGDAITLDYELQDYTNFMNTGYNGGSHTEPHFRIWTYFVERSSQRYTNYSNLVSDAIIPSISGQGSNQSLDVVEMVITNNGSEDLTDFSVAYMIDDVLITTEQVSSTLVAGASMTHTFSQLESLGSNDTYKFYGIVTHPNDENSGDNISKNITGFTVSADEIADGASFINVYPNPLSNGILQVELDPTYMDSKLDLMSMDGKVIQSYIIQSANLEMTINDHGIYLIRITHPDGFIATRRIVVMD